MAPDISECTCGFWFFAVVKMCESGSPNPSSHYQFDVLHKIVFLVFSLDSCTQILSGLLWTSCWCVVGGWCRGLGHPCCVLRRIADYRLTATAVWLGYFFGKWNMRAFRFYVFCENWWSAFLHFRVLSLTQLLSDSIASRFTQGLTPSALIGGAGKGTVEDWFTQACKDN